MKKIVLAVLLIMGLKGLSGAAEVARGLTHTHIVSSGIAFDRGTLMRVYCATVPATQLFNTAFVQFFDTTTAAVIPAGGLAYEALRNSSANVATPPLMLTSSGTATQVNGTGLEGVFYLFEPYGISFNRDAFMQVTIGSPGPAGWGGCTLYWRRDDW